MESEVLRNAEGCQRVGSGANKESNLGGGGRGTGRVKSGPGHIQL